MKYIIFLFSFAVICNAQNGKVGINTDAPQTTLDVAGDLNVSQSIYLNGENISAGTTNQLITSGGDSQAASWTSKEIPLGMDSSLTTSYMDSFVATTGIEFDNASAGNTEGYLENALLDSSIGWKEIPELQNDITIYKSENRVNLFLQTMVQFEGNSFASFGCGYFINDNMLERSQFRLKGVRTDVMFTPTGSFKLFNMNTTITNLAPENYTIKVACIKRNISGTNKIGIGKALTDTLNTDMAQSSLSVTVLEAY